MYFIQAWNKLTSMWCCVWCYQEGREGGSKDGGEEGKRSGKEEKAKFVQSEGSGDDGDDKAMVSQMTGVDLSKADDTDGMEDVSLCTESRKYAIVAELIDKSQTGMPEQSF